MYVEKHEYDCNWNKEEKFQSFLKKEVLELMLRR
jgi:hypothetical protein